MSNNELNKSYEAIITGFHPMPKGFMVWDKRDQCFAKSLSDYRLYLNICFRYDTTGRLYFAENDRFIILQDTGLKDKDGKEIFEGSIVGNGFCRAVCVWDKSDAGFDFIPIIGNDNTKGFLEDYKIVGHILSNPKLLEEKNEV